MKKYKLIKKYPNSPVLGTIISFDKGQWFAHFLPEMRDDEELNSIGCKEILSYTEFWELIIEKDYEILLYRNNNNGSIINDKRNNSDLIYSVKRLFDGEIFTIGDIINYGVIENFEVRFGEIKVLFHGRQNNNQYTNLHAVDHTKKPLFTTKDGVDIFEGDKFYCIDDENYTIRLRDTNDGLLIHLKDIQERCYKDKSKAEDWILMNKPTLNVKEVFKIFNITIEKSTYAEMILKLVKEKLKQN